MTGPSFPSLTVMSGPRRGLKAKGSDILLVQLGEYSSRGGSNSSIHSTASGQGLCSGLKNDSHLHGAEHEHKVTWPYVHRSDLFFVTRCRKRGRLPSNTPPQYDRGVSAAGLFPHWAKVLCRPRVPAHFVGDTPCFGWTEKHTVRLPGCWRWKVITTELDLPFCCQVRRA